MGMTRRTFLQTLLAAGAAVVAGLVRVGGRVPPRRVIRAEAGCRYPGRLRPLRNVGQPGKWRG
jgi:hypothetical protein